MTSSTETPKSALAPACPRASGLQSGWKRLLATQPQGDRDAREDARRDCGDEGGAAGKDKRDYKQEGRSDEGGTSDTADKS
ncbi:MAG: hypothetical protein U9Q81_19560 [Pseudomonadota bacterium]|nr:hypothetical protein [Pseudomonadota bacterium]